LLVDDASGVKPTFPRFATVCIFASAIAPSTAHARPDFRILGLLICVVFVSHLVSFALTFFLLCKRRSWRMVAAAALVAVGISIAWWWVFFQLASMTPSTSSPQVWFTPWLVAPFVALAVSMAIAIYRWFATWVI
jgi:hypothetical protein